MKISKHTLRSLIHECINEMHDEMQEAKGDKKFVIYYKKKNGKDAKTTVMAQDKDDAMAMARRKLAGRYYDLFGARELDEMTTTGDVAGYDAPMGTKLTDLIDDEDD